MDEDRPPAGTACAVCRNHNHFCPAVAWAKDRPEIGVCAACRDGEDCSFFAAIRVRDAAQKIDIPSFSENHTQAQFSPGRSIPRSEWKAEEMEIQLNREEYVISPKERKAIAEEPADLPYAVIADKYKVSAASVVNIRREAGVYEQRRRSFAKAIKPANLNTVPQRLGSATPRRKEAERAKATELIKAGASIRNTALGSGLSQQTIINMRKEMGVVSGNSKPPSEKPNAGFSIEKIETKDTPIFEAKPAPIILIDTPIIKNGHRHYAAVVIDDLLAKRSAIDVTIAAIRSLYGKELDETNSDR